MRSNGFQTNRDSWNYNSSLAKLTRNAKQMVAHYNLQVDEFQKSRSALTGSLKEQANAVKSSVKKDPTLFSWIRADYTRVAQGVK